jgi:molybdopterin/thiamine biosynthesis adenylyltransferase/rhodanese-related sulfurtransferase
MMQNLQNNERYSRQLNLQGFGLPAQQKLQDAKVLVIGAGGLGCPVLQYLTAAGIGTIGIADHDLVSLSNLQRQVLYSVDDLGLGKAKQAASRLSRLNPDIIIHTHAQKVESSNVMDLLATYDIIVDGTDNFASRYLIADACSLLGKPLVFAAVYQYEGQLAVFNVPDRDGLKTTYRDLFPTPPTAMEAPDCNAAGVLGVLPGTLGIMQATEVIKLITGVGDPLINQLLTYNALTADTYTINISLNPSAQEQMPQTEAALKQLDYEFLCSSISTTPLSTIDAAAFENYKLDKSALILDVREFGEWPQASFSHLQIPLRRLKENFNRLEKEKIIVFCQSGKRSAEAAAILQEHFGRSKEIYCLEGGIARLEKNLDE